MITQSVLSAILYTPPPALPASATKVRDGNNAPSAPEVALSVLQVFSDLSFVISQFGGVTSQTEGGFTELRRTFYTALDLLSADVAASETYVRKMSSREGMSALRLPLFLVLKFEQVAESSNSLPSSGSNISLTDLRTHTAVSSKRALDLACIEQLVPVLSLATIETSVFPLCLPYVSFKLNILYASQTPHL